MKILITGARSYVAYYWGLSLKAKHEVIYCDSLAHPFCRYVPFDSQYIRVAPPAQDTQGFKRDIQAIVLEHGVDLVMPTCEEVFYLSSFAGELGCRLFCPDHSLLTDLHHKHHVFGLLPECPGVFFPQTQLVFDRSDVMRLDTTILKPVFSRFGAKVIMNPKGDDLSAVDGSQPWVQQEKITGRSLCSYAVAVNGKMVAYSCYHAKYSISNSAALGIDSVNYPKIEAFNKTFIERHNYTGQVAFDFIEDEVRGGLYVIECNPRGTSGIHLLVLDDLEEAVFGTGAEVRTHQKLMVFRQILGLYNRLGALSGGRRVNLSDELRGSVDILNPAGEPAVSSRRWLLLFEMGWRMIRHGCSLAESTTYDIEWNGQPLREPVLAPMQYWPLGDEHGDLRFSYGHPGGQLGLIRLRSPYGQLQIERVAGGDWSGVEAKIIHRKIRDQEPERESIFCIARRRSVESET